MDREEMIRILEEIIRDRDTNPIARCTAIRTLRDLAPEPPAAGAFADLDELRPQRGHCLKETVSRWGRS